MIKSYSLPALLLLFFISVFITPVKSSSVIKHKLTDTSLFQDLGDRVVLNNGIVSATITKGGAYMVSYKYKGLQMLKSGYYSMDGKGDYMQPKKCLFSIKKQTDNLVDLAFKSTWAPGLRHQAVDIELHYVIEKGTSGIYCYAVLDHPASYPKTGFGEWRFVWKVPEDLFDHIMVDSLRNMELPTSADFASAQKTSIPESVKLTTGVKAGTYECKYGYSVEYYDAGTYGQASNKYKVGGWAVLGGYDFFNDGPTQADLNAAYGATIIHLGRDHYASSSTTLEAGEQWGKIFGPYLLYVNSGADANAMWADAKRKVVEEKAKWPYKWLTDRADYPAAAERGKVSGKFAVTDPFKPNVKGGNAWVGLTVPGADWEKDSKHYQYWIKADANGKFTILNIRPGVYTLHAYVTGAVGEFAKENIIVKKGVINIGNLTWNIPRDKGKLIWEIGVPDRTAREFKFGKQYWNSFMWETYCPALSNPLVYTVGSSDWHKDWNYVQSAYWNKDSTYSAWPWKINFNLNKLPSAGDATFTFAFASADRSRLTTYVNDDTKPFDVFTPTLNTGGNTLVRQGIHAKYSTYVLKIPVSKLRAGNNTITLVSNKGIGPAEHIMYDYISMEVPQ